MSELNDNLPENRKPTDEPGAETIDVRRGMFRARGTGDTSGYGGLVRPVRLPGESQRPYGGWFDEAADHLERLLPGFDDAIEKVVVDHDELTFFVRRERLTDDIEFIGDAG